MRLTRPTLDSRLQTLDFLRLWSDQYPTGCREIPTAWLTREIAASNGSIKCEDRHRPERRRQKPPAHTEEMHDK
jgi:hypothetical protein